MQVLHSTKVMVKCPHCNGTFSPEEALGHDIRVELEKQFEQNLAAQARILEDRIKRQESERYKLQLMQLQQETQLKGQRLKTLEEETIHLKQREKEISDREERIEIEMKKRLLDRERIIREQADKAALEKALLEVRERESKLSRDRETMELILKKRVHEEAEKAREEERMKVLELQKKLDDQGRLINEMKRKSEQGSMQLQGEIQELALEDYLRATFPRDGVEEVAKGKRGGDCVHIVRDQYGRICGKILYESKRTKHFSYEWLAKVKEDMRLQQTDMAVIVTEALPDGMTRFGEVDGVWVCTYVEFKALAVVFRSNLARLGEVLVAQENRGDKMDMIYRYVTGVEFRQKLEAAFESFHEMQDDLIREKSVIMSQWSKREKRLIKSMENLVCLYGDIRGIAGGAVQEIKALEMTETIE